MYSNKILNVQESTPILNAHTKKVWKLIVCTSYISRRVTDGTLIIIVVNASQVQILNKTDCCLLCGNSPLRKVIMYLYFNGEMLSEKRGCPRGIMVKAMDCGVRSPVELLRSLSDKYSWERYEPTYPPNYGLNSTTTVLLGEWLWH